MTQGGYYKIMRDFSLNLHLIKTFITIEIKFTIKWPNSFPGPPKKGNLPSMKYWGIMRNINPYIDIGYSVRISGSKQNQAQ